ncbi:MAG: peroxidase family protein [Pseudomonadota bacterium]
MLYSQGRGVRAAPFAPRPRGGIEGRLDSALDDALVAMRTVDAPGASYGYMFGFAPEAPDDPDAGRRLDALAAAMSEAASDPAEAFSDIPPVWLLFAQLLDHDLSAAVDRAGPRLELERPGMKPRARDEVQASLVNLRDGAFRLQSLYHADAGHGALAAKLTRLMREPGAPARMRLDRPEPSPRGAVTPPHDGGADLLRLGRLLSDDPEQGVTAAEIRALPEEIRETFLRGGEINPARAVIGDIRNDWGLTLAQLHVALLRFHNRVADWLADRGEPPERLFDSARALTQRHLQWIILEAYLPRICDPGTLARIRRAGAPVYTEFANAVRPTGSGRLPIPLEYIVGAARFRQSMVRGEADHNRFHGRPEGGAAPVCDRMGLDCVHACTGAALAWRLPADRVIDWRRYAQDPPAFPDRGSRRIDTLVTPPQGHEAAFRSLARRVLGREMRLNLPAAQDCAAEFNSVYGDLIRPLNREELASGHTGEAVRDGLAERTPIWFYVLKEAEILGHGRRLGPLGTALVAETLIGVLAGDPGSIWRGGPEGGLWTPACGARPNGREVDGIEALLQAAEVL